MTRDETLARALPAIGERARLLSAENAPDDALDDAWTPPPSPAGDKATPPRSPAVAPALSPSSSSRASSVSSSSSRLSGSVHHHHHHGHLHRYQRRARREGAAPSNDMSPQPLLCAYNAASADVRPVRRRFLSSDVVAKPSAGSSSVSSNPRFLSPVSRLYAASTSSVSLRRWVTAKASAVRGGITRSLSLNKYPSPTASGDERASSPCSSPSGVVSPVRLRTRSDNYLLGHTRRSNAFAVGGELFPVQAGVGDSDSSDDDCGSQISSFDNVENAGDIINIDAAPVPLTSDEEREKLEKLHNLQLLLQEGFITVTEYKDRHVQLVGEPGSIPEPTISKTTDLLELELPIIYHEPPDFSQLRPRDAIKHVFDSVTCKWTSSRIQVKIDPQPFARGGLRQVFHLQDLSASKGPGQPYESYVAKVAINPNENPDTYFRDVEMQAVAAKFAKQYNSYNPPRRVEFLEAWILQLIPPAASTNGGDDDIPEGLSLHGTICGVEPFIAGEYHKHNNNFGYVSELERNTPQAFSHFTYEASGEQILVVDIQGVGDHYTDPQIHTRRGKEFGKGNLSVRGFARFLGSHRCNPICRYLKLTLINPKDDDPMRGNNDPKGTVPAQTYMSKAHVDKVDSVLCHYYTDSKAFQRYRGSALNRSGSERSRGQPLPPRRRRGIQEENKIEADEAENASIGSASNAERRLTTKLLLQDLRIDRSCSFFFCGADQQCSIS